MFAEILAPLEALRANFLTLGPAEQFAIVVSALGVTVVSALGWLITAIRGLLRIRSRTAELAITRSYNKTLQVELERAAEIRSQLERQIAETSPSAWLRRYEELAASSKHDALKALRIGYENIRRELAEALFLLSSHHAERGLLRPEEFGEAIALAQIAALIESNSARYSRHVLEVAEDSAAASASLGRFEDADEWTLPLAGGDPDLAEHTISQLLARADHEKKVGKFYPQLRLAALATRVAIREGLQHELPGTRASLELGRALVLMGRYEDAISEIDAVLPLAELKFAGRRIVSDLRYQRARALVGAKREQEALVEIDHLDEERSAGDVAKLMVSHLRAQALHALGRNEEAMTLIDVYLPKLRAHAKLENVDAFWAEQLRASTLAAMQHFPDALSAIDSYAGAEQNAKGAEHPDVLVTRRLRAEVIAALGQREEAGKELAEVARLLERDLGSSHPATKAASEMGARLDPAPREPSWATMKFG